MEVGKAIRLVQLSLAGAALGVAAAGLATEWWGYDPFYADSIGAGVGGLSVFIGKITHIL